MEGAEAVGMFLVGVLVFMVVDTRGGQRRREERGQRRREPENSISKTLLLWDLPVYIHLFRFIKEFIHFKKLTYEKLDF